MTDELLTLMEEAHEKEVRRYLSCLVRSRSLKAPRVIGARLPLITSFVS